MGVKDFFDEIFADLWIWLANCYFIEENRRVWKTLKAETM